MIENNECFVCGTQHLGSKCPNCGYEFSLNLGCPNLGFGGICESTHKFCKLRDDDCLNCEIWLKEQED